MRYYIDENHLDDFVKITRGGNISLRIIDWFVTNYSKKKDIVYKLYKDKDGNISLIESPTFYKMFNVYESYKGQLKSFSKRRFDPFCRRDRITIPYQSKNIETTIGQLNFFKWAKKHCIIDYIIKYKEYIENDMNNVYKVLNGDKNHKRRQELSKSAIREN